MSPADLAPRAPRLVLLATLGLALVAAGAGACKDEGGARPGAPDGGGGSGGEDGGGSDGGPQADAGLQGCRVGSADCGAGQVCVIAVADDGTRTTRCAGGCDPVAQDCPADTKCSYRQDGGARACVPRVGDAGAGEPCVATESSDTCGAGLVCVDADGPDGGGDERCAVFCVGRAQCDGDQECTGSVRPQGSDELAQVCGAAATRCALLGPPSCPTPLACYPGEPGEGVCAEEGRTPDGAPCGFSNQCAPGSACVRDPVTGGQVCQRLCSPSGTPGCAAGACTSLAGYEGEVGVCPP